MKSRGHVDTVRTLIDAGVNLADRDGVTPLRHARNRGFQAIENMLGAAGAQ